MKTNNLQPNLAYILFFERYQNFYSDFLNFSYQNGKTDFLIKSIYKCINVYIDYLKYKFNENKPCLPLKLIQKCSQKGYLNNSELFYSFFINFNAYFEAKEPFLKEKLENNIMELFKEETLNNFKKDILQNFSNEDYEDFRTSLESKGYEDNENSIETETNFGLKNFEIYLLKYVFTSEKTIKKVWITGSRATNTYTDFSDINLAIDCPKSSFKDIQRKIQSLPFKYKITILFIQNTRLSKTFKELSLLNKIIFYKKENKFPKLKLSDIDLQEVCKFLRIRSYKKYCQEFYKNLENYKKYPPIYELQKEPIASLRRIQIRYCKLLNIILKEFGFNETLPIKILYKCKELNIGYYIDWMIEHNYKLRAYYDNINSIETRFKIGENLLSDFENFNNIQIELDKLKHSEFIMDFLRIIDYTQHLRLLLNNDTVTYDNTVYNLPKKSFDTIQTSLKNNPEIKKAWVFGSRALDYSHKGSDIDMLIDCDLKHFARIKKEIENLNIPEAIDTQCTKNTSLKNFCTTNFIVGSKPIYDKSDFDIYWDDSKKSLYTNEINISNFL